ncbi:MAG: FGGY family carbohydrate kinase [Acidobacteriaceae bacterium]
MRNTCGRNWQVGLSGQMHSLVLLDAEDEALRPSIISCDQRTGEQCRTTTDRVGARRLIELAAKLALTGFTLPMICWILQN